MGVVWFENRLREPPPVVEESEGTIDLEAEQPTIVHDTTWVERAPVRGHRASGPAALQAHNGQPIPSGTQPAAPGAGVTYAVDAAGGDYQVWTRLFVPARFGVDFGGDPLRRHAGVRTRVTFDPGLACRSGGTCRW